MEKGNRIRFVKSGLICFIILFFLPFFNISYIYAGNVSDNAETYRTKGYDAQQRGDIDTAIEWYQKAAGISPDYASPHNDLGILFETKGWLDRAEAEYQKALAIDPSYKEVHTNLALLYERKGELEKAAFHWMRRYKLGNPEDPWTQEAKSRLVKLGLLDKTEKESQRRPEQRPVVEKKEAIPVKKESPAERPLKKKQKPEPAAKKDSGWTRVGSAKKAGQGLKPSPTKSNTAFDAELQESLKLAEERLRKEKDTKRNTKAVKKQAETKAVVNSEANTSYNKARDYYNKGEYAMALDVIRLAKQGSAGNKSLMGLEEEIKFKMKEARIEDYYKEGMINYRQKNFTGARKEFESILSILPE